MNKLLSEIKFRHRIRYFILIDLKIYNINILKETNQIY